MAPRARGGRGRGVWAAPPPSSAPIGGGGGGRSRPRPAERARGAWGGSRRGTGRFGVPECLDLGPSVDLGVAVRGGEVGVPEPAADDVHFDAGLEEVHCPRYLYLIL